MARSDIQSRPQTMGRLESDRLDESQCNALTTYAEHCRVSAGEEIVRVGEPGAHFYLVLEGRFGIERPTPEGGALLVEECGPGELFGLLAFFTGAASQVAVRCKADSRVAVISRGTFHKLLDVQPGLWRQLQQIGLARMRSVQLSEHLDRLFGPFGAMLPFVLRDLEGEIDWLTLRSGEALYRAGDEAQSVYVLMAGRLHMMAPCADGGMTLTNTVLSGETVGEVALLTGQPQRHTVHAVRDSELVCLSRYSFELMLQRNTRSIYNVCRILGDRLAHGSSLHAKSSTAARCVSLIPATPEVQLDAFVEALVAVVEGFGLTKYLDSAVVEEELDSPGISQAHENEAGGLRINQWLYQQEESWRYLVYRGDPAWSDWSARCVRQSDQVVVVADAAQAPCLNAVARRLAEAQKPWTLVLLHPADIDRPRNTSRWLGELNVESVYHIRRGHSPDVERLGRVLAGKAVGLVLGGGGARGFAHIGVLRAMETLGIPVDMVGGTSMGAPIAGFVAQGLCADEIDQRCRQAYHSIIDLTLPVASLMAGKRISESIRQQTGDWNIEDYWLPFYCVSTSLTNARTVIHRRGSSALAIRSSVSIPGILPPVPNGEQLLVDGAVLNNLPVDVMREFNPLGTVIAVDVTEHSGPSADADYGTGLSGWRVMGENLLPWRQRSSVPGIAATIMQSMFVGSALKRQQVLDDKLADIYINVPVQGVGLLQFDAQDVAAQLGYEASIDSLTEWVKNRTT